MPPKGRSALESRVAHSYRHASLGKRLSSGSSLTDLACGCPAAGFEAKKSMTHGLFDRQEW